MAEWEKQKEKEPQAATPTNPPAADIVPQPEVEASTEKPKTKEKKIGKKGAPRPVPKELKTDQKREAPRPVQQHPPPAPSYTWDHAGLREVKAMPMWQGVIRDLSFRRPAFKDANHFKTEYYTFAVFYDNAIYKVSQEYLVFYVIKMMWITYSKFDLPTYASLHSLTMTTAGNDDEDWAAMGWAYPRNLTETRMVGGLDPVLHHRDQSQFPRLRLRPRARKILNQYRHPLSGQDTLRPDRLSRTQLIGENFWNTGGIGRGMLRNGERPFEVHFGGEVREQLYGENAFRDVN
ncbi:hypothetical protein GCG54_00004170 [Colletotrichum gloeosporioides]|uniref:Uncharacterized protein n=1 Tax=Colletotrichum gloeosporioides TaxID=474922 RepID=A0A8H4CJ31_COLGL|nr:uncharacterized protein GCG54_00004170 [Colletotrichum gloeosporioides]KAF3804900.1 hypothetical protein GCG54_00004170 [Colletotrichum gloeosporioides]